MYTIGKEFANSANSKTMFQTAAGEMSHMNFIWHENGVHLRFKSCYDLSIGADHLLVGLPSDFAKSKGVAASQLVYTVFLHAPHKSFVSVTNCVVKMVNCTSIVIYVIKMVKSWQHCCRVSSGLRGIAYFTPGDNSDSFL